MIGMIVRRMRPFMIMLAMNIVVWTFLSKMHSLTTLETYMDLSLQADAAGSSMMIQSITEHALLLSTSSSSLSSASGTSHDGEPPSTSSSIIRTWGCNLQQTPLIFIHIGKSGGGMVRARFAAAAQDYSRLNWKSMGDGAYYPLRPTDKSNNNSTHNPHGIDSSNLRVLRERNKAYFCNSGHANFKSTGARSYEKTLYCHATTPLGQAVSCPEPVNRKSGQCQQGCDIHSDSCRTVYVGHNLLGNEMHWLPPRYLQKWWHDTYQQQQQHEQQHVAASDDEKESNMIAAFLQSLTPNDKTWCPYYRIARPQDYNESIYIQCSSTLAPAVDKHAVHAVHAFASSSPYYESPSSSIQQQQQQQHHIHNPNLVDWSPIYASMPVLRTTLMREPFSWLLSKFFWHRPPNGTRCDDLDWATRAGGTSAATEHVFYGVDIKKVTGAGWLNRHAWYYILTLCGEDCDARYFMGIGNLQQFERQATNNIRHSIAVVGLLNETDRFYDMVSARVVSIC
jgi:hypothetical protein